MAQNAGKGIDPDRGDLRRGNAVPRGRVLDPSQKAREARGRITDAIEEGLDPELADQLPDTGDRNPSPEKADAMAEVLGIDFSKYGYKVRPAFMQKGPTPYALVQKLASLGLSQRQVHMTLGWSEKLWYTRKREDPLLEECYDMGFNRGIAIVANRHFTAAMQGSVPAMQFILRTKGGFTEPKEEQMGPQEAANLIKQFLTGIKDTTGKAPEPAPEAEATPE